MKHEIDADTLNSDIEYCINEYVRYVEHREILRQHWFHQATFDQLADKHHMSLTAIKKIIYDIGDPILIRASKRSTKRV